MQIVKNFLNSEKAIASGLCIVAATVLTALGHITAQEWMSYSQVILGIYVGGKAIQGAAAALAKRHEEEKDPR